MAIVKRVRWGVAMLIEKISGREENREGGE
jgi:hypothetical protein